MYFFSFTFKERDGHDWYCFECHSGGEVVLCTTCHRVYHEVCVGQNVKASDFVCPVCEVCILLELQLSKNMVLLIILLSTILNNVKTI